MNTQDKAVYDYTQFSFKDIQSYNKIFDQLPYDEQLQSLFSAFKKEQRNLKRKDERHLDGRELTDKLVETECTHNHPAAVVDQVGQQFEHQQLYAALLELAPISRRRIYLCYFSGLTQKEIACMEGVSQQSVQESLKWALKKLKESLRDTL